MPLPLLRWPAVALLLGGFAGLPQAETCKVVHPEIPQHSLEGADLHYKLVRYLGGAGPPPLEEVFFATQNLSKATEEQVMRECPGLLICAFVLLAEARLPVSPEESAAAVAKADMLAARLPEERFAAELEAWPVQETFASYSRAAAAAATVKGVSPTVQFVVCHCRESLEWLANGQFHLPHPERVRLELFVYEKCGQETDTEPFERHYQQVSVVPVIDGDVRKDECSAYLRHLVDHYSNPGDYTAFFQADAGDHMQWSHLSLVMHALEQHTLQVGFVHLNYPRLVSSLSPCREEVFRQIFGRPPGLMLGSYCCAQFLVARERILANPLARYEKMLAILNEDSPSVCHDIPGHSTQCLMFEVYWHVVFGEPDALPDRGDNAALPLFLRLRDVENESYLPPGSLFLDLALNV